MAVSLEDLAQEIENLKAQKIVVLPKEKSLAKFYGTGQPDLDEFHEQIEALYASRHCSPQEKTNILLSHLGDSVKEEVYCHPATKRDSAENILKLLKEVYGDQKTLSELLGQFYMISQRSVESIREFSHRLNRAFLKINQKAEAGHPLGDTVLRDHFLSKVNNDFLRKRLREEVHKQPAITFLDVRNEAIRWAEDSPETDVSATTSAVSATATTSVLEDILSKMTAIESRLLALERAPGQGPNREFGRPKFTRDGKPICLRCQKPGHILRNCPGNGTTLQ